MENYYFRTIDPVPNNEQTMAQFLNTNEHFYSVFDVDAQIILEDGTYAEVEDGLGKKWGVHASGNGDFNNHIITFEEL